MRNPCWLIRLQGERFDTEELPRWFPSGDVFAFEEDGAVYLSGAFFEKHNQAVEVLRAARETLGELSAVIKLVTPNHRTPDVDTTVLRSTVDGVRVKHHIFEVEPGHFRMKGGAALTLPGSQADELTQAQRLHRAAKSSPHLMEALRLWSDPESSWPRLYRALEELETELGSRVDQAGLCHAKERERFTRTANTAEVAGQDARHGSGRFKAPPSPMSLAEAREFIRSVIDGGLRLRA
jgi:hypothetical protein